MTESNNISGSGISARNPSTTSTSLLLQVKAGDQLAWSRLSNLYTPLVYHWCRHGGLHEADAADVVQEIFRTVVVKLNQFRHDREGDTFRGWLRTITRNKLGDYYRQCKKRAAAAGGTEAQQKFAQIPINDPTSLSGPVASVEADLLYRRVFDFISSEFEEPSWRAFMRVAVDGAKPKDVAAELGISVNAVYLAKSRILRRVREELGEVA